MSKWFSVVIEPILIEVEEIEDGIEEKLREQADKIKEEVPLKFEVDAMDLGAN